MKALVCNLEMCVLQNKNIVSNKENNIITSIITIVSSCLYSHLVYVCALL